MQKSLTYDEISYISVGYALLTTGDYRMNPEQPPLVKIVAGLPLLLIQPTVPLEHKSWEQADQWQFGHEFFFNSGNNLDQILLLSRIPFIFIGALIGYFVYLFSLHLYGKRAALLSLVLYTFSPNILAHTRLATTDVALSGFLFISIYFYRKYLKGKKVIDIALTGICLGIAAGFKFTALYFLPVYVLLAFSYQFQIKKQTFLELIKNTWNNYALYTLCMYAIAFMILLIVYKFQFDVLVEGFLIVLEFGKTGRYAYLLGNHYVGSHPLFYPISFLFKTPLAMMILALLTFIYGKEHTSTGSKSGFLLIPIIVFLIPTLMNAMNLGLRHILIVYPFMHVYVGSIANNRKKILQQIILILVGLYIISSVAAYPHYLSYMNEAVGGPSKGYHYFVDSNYDWGQDGKLLAQYLKQNQIKNSSIAYFGTDDLTFRGLQYHNLGCEPTQGIIAISANYLVGINKEQAACRAWLHSFAPVERVGQTIFIFNITHEFTAQEIRDHLVQYQKISQEIVENQLVLLEEKCATMCQNHCEFQELTMLSSGLQNGNCGCNCG